MVKFKVVEAIRGGGSSFSLSCTAARLGPFLKFTYPLQQALYRAPPDAAPIYWEPVVGRETTVFSRTRRPPMVRMREHRDHRAHEQVTGALARMGDHRLPKQMLSGKLKDAGQHAPGGEGGGKQKEWTGRVAEDIRMFEIGDEWRTTALDVTQGVIWHGVERGKQFHDRMEEGSRKGSR